jgi:flagellar hook-basal body complex protein FliE
MPAELARASSLLGGGNGFPVAAEASEPFAALLAGKVKELTVMQSHVRDLVTQAHSGHSVDSAELLTAVQKSDLALSTMLQVRDRLIEAYREIQQIQI